MDERPRRLSGARPGPEESADILLDRGEVHFPASGLPERGNPPRQIGGRSVQPRGITAADPHRRGVPEGAGNDLHDPLAGLERRSARKRSRQVPWPDQHRVREHRRILDLSFHEGDREGEAGRLEPDAGGEIHRTQYRAGSGADDEHGFGLVRDHVVPPRVAEQAIRRIELRQVQRRGLRLPRVFREAALVGRPEPVHHHPVPVGKLEVEGARAVVVEPHRPAVGESRLSHPVVGGELVEHLRGVPRIHHVERHDEAAHLLAAVLVDGFGGPDPVHVHAALAEELLDVVHHRGDRVAPKLPEVRQPGGRRVRRVEGPHGVRAGNHYRIRAPERRGNDGEEALARSQAVQLDAALFRKLPDPAVRPAHQEERRRLRPGGDVRIEDRQTRSEGGGLETEPARDVGGGGHFLRGRVGGEDDPGVDEVHHAVAVPVLEEDARREDVLKSGEGLFLLRLARRGGVEQREGRERPHDPGSALRTHDELPSVSRLSSRWTPPPRGAPPGGR